MDIRTQRKGGRGSVKGIDQVRPSVVVVVESLAKNRRIYIELTSPNLACLPHRHMQMAMSLCRKKKLPGSQHIKGLELEMVICHRQRNMSTVCLRKYVICLECEWASEKPRRLWDCVYRHASLVVGIKVLFPFPSLKPADLNSYRNHRRDMIPSSVIEFQFPSQWP